MSNDLTAQWCLVANVKRVTVKGEEQREALGTKHFSPGTKVYCFPALWGDGYENITVLGRHRGGRRLIRLVMPSKHLTNWRMKHVYDPRTLEMLDNAWGSDDDAKYRVAEYVQVMTQRESAEE